MSATRTRRPATVNPVRVACTERKVEVPGGHYDAALRLLASIERLGACRAEHAIEMRVDGEWLPAHLGIARTMLAARPGTVVETFDGPLTVNTVTWTPEDGRRADAAGEPGSQAWTDALGTPRGAVATSDGRSAATGMWHIDDRCGGPAGPGDWVRYERWTAEGRVAHGFVCRDCRGLLQVG